MEDNKMVIFKYKSITMKPIYLLFLLIFCFSYQTEGQIVISTAEELKEYLEGEWQLRKRVGGFAGETSCYPQSDTDYRLSFMPIENSDSTMMYTNYKNETLIVEAVVYISFDEIFGWELNNLYFPELYGLLPFFIREEIISNDTLWFGDGAFDGYGHMFTRDIVSNTVDLSNNFSRVKVFPNPTFQSVEIAGIEISDIQQILIYSKQGQLHKELNNIKSSTIELPNSAGLNILKFLMKDGSQIVKTVSKLSNN